MPTESKLRIGEEITCDLDGDGLPERIRIDGEPDLGGGGYGAYDSYRLRIRDRTLTARGVGVDSSFAVVDIDSADAQMELAVTAQGPSDDYTTRFFTLQADTILDMGELPGTYEMSIDGSGLIRTSARGAILHTWYRPSYWRLDEKHHLVEIPLALYLMDTPVRVLRRLTLQKSPSDRRPALRLRAGERVLIRASDDREWCLVRTESGTTGWFAVDGYDTIRGTGRRAVEYFEGLSFAD